MMERNVVPYIMNALLDGIAKNFEESNNAITDDALMSLYGIFDKVLYSALELIETNSVTLLQLKNSSSSAGEILLQVTNKQGSSYILFPRINYCRCVFYQQKVIRAKTYPACKHVIAANLAYIWNKYRTFDINFSNFKSYLDEIRRNDLELPQRSNDMP